MHIAKNPDRNALRASSKGLTALKALLFSTLTAVAATATLPLSALAAHLSTSTYTSEIGTLNSAFGSRASGSASIIETLDSIANTASLQVKVNVTGLQDLTEFGGVHVAHIHGQFLGNASLPLFEQGNGPFFAGTGGRPVPSRLPTLAMDDADGDGYLNFIEGRPAYGPVSLNLSSEQQPAPPSGLPPLTQFLQRAGAGEISPGELFPSGTEFVLDTTYSFDLSDADQARQYNNLNPLDFREIVIHGLTLPAEISNPIDAAVTAAGSGAPLGVDVGDGQVFRLTAPVAAGTFREVAAQPVPEPMSMSLISVGLLAAGLGATRRRPPVA